MVTLSFIAASILVLVTPGPTNTVLAACGATMPFRRAAILPLAEAIGYIIALQKRSAISLPFPFSSPLPN
jgi:threonine/homoserine/homoserine lactone efflux protein